MAVLAWCALYLAMLIASGLIHYVIGYAVHPPPDPRLMQGLEALVRVLAGGVLSAAIYRTILRPEDSGFAGLKFGADEVRMIVFFAVFFAGLLAMRGAEKAALDLRLAVSVCIIAAATPLVLVGPAIFEHGSIREGFFAGLRRTRGWYWGLLVMNLLTYLQVMVAVRTTGGLVDMTERLRAGMTGDPAWFFQIFILLTGMAVSGALLLLLMVAPAAAAYRDLSSAATAEDAPA